MKIYIAPLDLYIRVDVLAIYIAPFESLAWEQNHDCLVDLQRCLVGGDII